MDETQIAAILSAFDSKLATDPQIRAILRKITGGKATFADTADYAIRAGNLLGQFLSGEILDISPEGREVLCAALLKNRYTDLNKLLGDVQRAQDKPLGISLNPIKAPFPAERVQQVAHSLLDPGVKPEVIRRRANAPVATVAKSFHDDYIKINAQKRNDLGFKCYLNRVAVNGCCSWCTEVAGRYAYGDHPKDIFRRHDNCNCTVTFENGRQRQDVWSKRTWEADPEEVMQNASEPTVLPQDAAESLQNAALSRLTLAGERDIINTREMFRKEGDDPMFEVTGRAIDSNPKEVAEMTKQLQSWGVEINHGSNTLGYGGIRNGVPGAMSVTDDASYSAWCHEFDHAKKDREAGWNAVRVLWFDPAERERRERAAYEIEINLAHEAGREDIAQRLEVLRDEEIERIWHDYNERFGNPE